MSTGKAAGVKVDEVIQDPTCRLDVTYWKKFAVDFNVNSNFTVKPLSLLGEIRDERVSQQAVQKETYHTFRILYEGLVELGDPVKTEDTKSIDRFKVARPNDLVVSRINGCRGSVAVLDEIHQDCICTNETHVFVATDTEVDVRYLRIVLRHPYYQDLMLSQSTGASIERKRLHEAALLEFEIPVPAKEQQLTLIRETEELNAVIDQNIRRIERLRKERNRYVLNALGIDLVYERASEVSYALAIDDVLQSASARMDFEHNKPSYDLMLPKVFQGRYELVEIGQQEDPILMGPIASGSTPSGGIYPSTGVPFVQGNNILENGLDMTEHRCVTKEFHANLNRSRLVGNEVLVTIAGTIGRVGVNATLDDANVNQAIAVLRLRTNMLAGYLAAFLNSDGGKIQFDKHRHEFGTPNINLAELGKILVPKPSLEVQRERVRCTSVVVS